MPATPQVLTVCSLDELYIGYDQPLDNNPSSLHFRTSVHLVGKFPWEDYGDGWSKWQHGAPFVDFGSGPSPVPPYVWNHTSALKFRCRPLHQIASDPIYQGGNVTAARDIFYLDPGDIWIEETWSSPNDGSYTYTTVLDFQPIDIIKIFFQFGVYCSANNTGGPTIGNWVSNIQFCEESLNFEAVSLTDPTGQHISFGGSSCEASSPPVGNSRGASGVMWWLPTLETHVVFKPVDASGAPISGKRVWILFGDIRDAFNITGSTDLSRYLYDRPVPVDETITIPGKTVYANVSIGGPPDPLAQHYERADEVMSEGTRCTVAWQYASLDKAPAANGWLEAAQPRGPVIQHLSSEDCGAVDQVVATVSLPATKALNPSWTLQSGTGSVAGGLLTSTGSNTVFRATYTTPLPDLRPYRFLAFEHNVSGGGSVSATIRVKQRLAGVREYPVSLGAAGTTWVDILNPTLVAGTNASSLSKLSTSNQANLTGSGGPSNSDRFGGVTEIDYIEIVLSNAAVTLSNVAMRVRWAAELSLLNFDNATDDTDDLHKYVMCGHVDGRDAFRIETTGTVSQDVNFLVSQQKLTLVSTNYPIASGMPFATYATVGNGSLPSFSLQDLSDALRMPQDIVAGANIRCSPKVTDLGGNRFFYGLKTLHGRGWWNTVRCNCVWGNGFSATAVPFSRTTVEVKSPSNPAFDHTYKTSRNNGYGLYPLIETRQAFSSFASNVTHWCPGHPAVQTKQTVRLGNSSGGVATNGHRYHITVEGVPEGNDAAVSYDVAPHMRHFVAYLQEDRAWIRRSSNANHRAINEVDTGIDCTSLCLRIEQGGLQRVGLLYVAKPSRDVQLVYSGDDGETWSMPTTLGSSGLVPAMVYSPSGTRYYYWLEDVGGGGATIKGQIRDALDNVIEPTFTVLTGVSQLGLAADESVGGDGLHRITLFYIDTLSTLTSIVSYNGKSFT